MEFVFERNKVRGWDHYRIKKSEACNCLKSLDMVVVGQKYDQNSHNESCGVFIARFETVGSWEDGFEIEQYYKINCCPICKKEIAVKVIEGKDCTEDHRKLRTERDEIHRKAMRCDSKKRTDELLKKERELDKQIKSFYDEELWLAPDNEE